MAAFLCRARHYRVLLLRIICIHANEARPTIGVLVIVSLRLGLKSDGAEHD